MNAEISYFQFWRCVEVHWGDGGHTGVMMALVPRMM